MTTGAMSLSDIDTDSETSTLLPKDQQTDDTDRGDRPIQLDGFKRNVLVCKIALGALLPPSLALDVVHAVAWTSLYSVLVVVLTVG